MNTYTIVSKVVFPSLLAVVLGLANLSEANAQGGLTGGLSTGGGNESGPSTNDESVELEEPRGPADPDDAAWSIWCPKEAREATLAKKYQKYCGEDIPPPDYLPSNSHPLLGWWRVTPKGDEAVKELIVEVFFDADAKKLRAHHFWLYHDSSVYKRENYPRTIQFSGRRARFESWGRIYTVNLESKKESLRGSWHDRDDNADVAPWYRLPNEVDIKTVRIIHAIQEKSGTSRDDVYTLGQRPGLIRRSHPVTCDVLGNCTRVHVELYGDYFGSQNYPKIWIDPAYRMLLRSGGRGFMCSNGDWTSYYFWCPNPEKHPRKGVVGLKFTVLLLSGIRPGPMNIWVDGVPIPINIELDGYPKDKRAEPAIAEFHAETGEGEKLDAITEHSPFRLHAKFEEPSPRAWLGVEMPDVSTVSAIENLPGSDSVHFDRSPKTVVLRPDADRLVYKSDMLAVTEKED